jgi:protein O-GlcNAc transferase
LICYRAVTSKDRKQSARNASALQAVRSRLASGQPAAAAGECHALLVANPGDSDTRHLYGRCLAALGRLDDAVTEFRRVLKVSSKHFPALVDLGVTYSLQGNHVEARQVLRTARTLDRRPAEVHFALGLCCLGVGELDEAGQCFRDAIARNPRFPDAHNNLGVALDRQGLLAEAVECFQRAIAVRPDLASAHGNLGDALLRLNQPLPAADAFRRKAELLPYDADAHGALGIALLKATEFEAAATALEHALRLDPNLASVAANLGVALYELKRSEPAAVAFRRALAVNPDLAEGLLGLGRISADRGDAREATRYLMAAQARMPADAALALLVATTLDEVGYPADAISALESAAMGMPENAEIGDALGRRLHRAGRLREAVACYERVLEIDAGERLKTQLNLGLALESLGFYSAAIESLDRVLAQQPNHAAAIAAVASCAFRTCEWNRAQTAIEQLAMLPEGIDSLHPFVMLSADIEPEVRAESTRRRARAISAGLTISAGFTNAALVPYTHDRLRIAYVSPDFRNHAVAHSIAGVIERHDRRRVDVIGVSLSAADNSAVGTRLAASFDEFIDASSQSDEHIVRLMREREVDIALDLAGFTVGARPAVFARRVAPVQVNYLGFPGSMGAPFMDFILADGTVVPTADEHLYAERVLRLPNSYLPFDSDRPIPRNCPSRAEVGLPSEGFIFCAFNNGYKITAEMFRTWLALLSDTPGSVLWLRGAGPETETNLRRAAREHGIQQQRLAFASFVEDLDLHLARLQLADLFLDTLPYNAHSSAAEALWAGVPVISCRGRTFAGRVGASLLSAANLPDLICDDLAAYRRRALELASTPAALRSIRERLAQNRSTAPLFDTLRYTRDLEATLHAAYTQALPAS